MIANLRDTTVRNAGAGLAQDQPRPHRRPDAGPARPERVSQADHVRADARPVSAQHGAFFLAEAARSPASSELRLIAELRLQAQGRRRRPVRVRRGAGGPGGVRAQDDPAHRGPRGLRQGRPRASGEAAPANVSIMPVLFEDQVLGVIELGVLPAVLRAAPAVPRPARRDDRRRRSTRSSPTGAPRSCWSSPSRSPRSCRASPVELRQTNDELEEKAALLAQQNRDIEVKNREIELAGIGLEEKAEQLAVSSQLQVGVPGQHVARAAHAAQQPADPGQAAGRQRRRQPDRQAGRVRADDPRRRQRPARR